ncbi:(2Fe-2S)-binding protein [Streptomyces tsukubensis]|uniref:(2Fe-2S)-binding protein n=1 Tax=Streptomyces tsukubensis TaxID=83656 RepID=UPI00098EF92D|nr:(2Fe-2S)-binding protein [Streptomyces tsukubensis]QFR93162.1 hypothetical protein GBW32_08770 [Streptomyces tsukubensis]
MYVCSCFGITEQQVKQHAEDGAGTPRKLASACKAGTDCGSCVRRIQALLGRTGGSRRAPATSEAGVTALPYAEAGTTALPHTETGVAALPAAHCGQEAITPLDEAA